MKFLSIAQAFSAFAIVAAKPDKSNLRKLTADQTTSECTELGEVAAQMIAFDYCPFSAADAYGASRPSYSETCREVAYGICEGAVYDNVLDNGCTISTSKLLELQDQCEEQVDSMIDGATDDDGCIGPNGRPCTCRDGSTCSYEEDCEDVQSGGCTYREPQSDRNGRLSCRNGEPCIMQNTACEDGSACKERDGLAIF